MSCPTLIIACLYLAASVLIEVSLLMNARLEEPPKTSRTESSLKTKKLEDVLSGHQLEEFLEFANRYYQETAKAKNGLWFPENALLERADLHPPMKNKILNVIVGQALGVSPAEGTDFIEEIWNSKVKGRSTVRSICNAIENERKDLRSLFFLRTTNSSKTALKEGKTEKELSTRSLLPLSKC